MIPPDFDDTFVNLGLGSLLAEMKEHFPQTYAQWQSQNTNVSSVYDALKKYAYRPKSGDKNVNAIDCRTYFYLRYFLEKVPENEDVMLVPTWVSYRNEPLPVSYVLEKRKPHLTCSDSGLFGPLSSSVQNVHTCTVYI